MNTTRLQENISALTDGELPACDVELTMAALADPHGRAAWEAYRLIGDVLRADAAAIEPAPDFAARLAARLAAERDGAGDDGLAARGAAGAPGPGAAVNGNAAAVGTADAAGAEGGKPARGVDEADGVSHGAVHGHAMPASPAAAVTVPPAPDGAPLLG